MTHMMGWQLPISSLLTLPDWVRCHFLHDMLPPVPPSDVVFHFLLLVAVLVSFFSVLEELDSTPKCHGQAKVSPDLLLPGHSPPAPS